MLSVWFAPFGADMDRANPVPEDFVVTPSDRLTVILANVSGGTIAMASKNKINVVSFFILGPPLKTVNLPFYSCPSSPMIKSRSDGVLPFTNYQH